MLLQALLTTAVVLTNVRAIDIAVSKGLGIDAFIIAEDRSIMHKYFRAGKEGWEPHENLFENMNGTAKEYAPSAVSTHEGELNYFVIGTDGAAYTKFWDGSNWNPVGKWHERLGGEFTSSLATASWGKGRIDLIGRGTDDAYYHLFKTKGSWQPDIDDWEDLGGDFSSQPAAISWGIGRLDIVGITKEGKVAHKYWDSSAWQPGVDKWEEFDGGPFIGDPVLSSMGENRFDIWVVAENGALMHKYWAGGQYSEWEDLGGKFSTAPKVVHHSPGKVDIVGQFDDEKQYRFKAFNGEMWLPDVKGWWEKGGKFATQPGFVSTRADELNILGVGTDGQLHLQFYSGGQWEPSATGYFPLGDTKNPYKKKNQHAGIERQYQLPPGHRKPCTGRKSQQFIA